LLRMPSKQHKLENLIKRLVLISGKGQLDLGMSCSAIRTTSAAGSSHTPLIVWNETLLIHISTSVQSSQIKFSPWPNNQIG
ncbi:hypothetical protein AAEH73_19895, partial [Shewanella algae]|uniref:hypothetical protein n=1 Tax=Shewanella algae TaxID=38313 RepID=UPI00313C6690